MKLYTADSAPMVADETTPTFALLTTDIADLSGDLPLAPSIDMPTLLDRCLGNVEFAQLLLEEFQSSVPQQLAGLARYTMDENGSAIRETAHSLRGIACTLAAEGLRQAATDLETAAIADDWKMIPQRIDRLHQEALRCLAEISHQRLVAKAADFANAQPRQA